MAQSIMVAGRFAGHTRKALEAHLRVAGHIVVRDLRHADLLLAGSRPGRALEQAEDAGISVIGADMLPSLLAAAGPVQPTSLLEDIHTTLTGAVTARSWSRLCQLLDRCTAAQLDAVLPACRDAVSAWPARSRSTPPGWLDALLDNGHEPRLSLCGCLTYSHSADRLGAEQGVALLEAAAEHMPLVRSIRLNHITDDTIWQGTLDSGLLCRFPELDLSSEKLGPEKLTQLLDAIDTRTVEALDLKACALGAEGAARLASRDWPRLRRLQLYQNQLTNEGLQALTATPHLARLQELSIGYNSLRGAEAGRLLASARFAPELTVLQLRYNALGAEGAAALARGHFPELGDLNIGCNEIGDEGMAAIAAARGMPRLAKLYDVGSRQQPLLTSEAMEALAQSPARAALRFLVVSRNTIDSDGFTAIMTSPHLSRLEVLTLDGNDLDVVRTPVLEVPRPAALRTLRLSIGSAEPRALAEALRSAEVFGGLDVLDLRLPYSADAQVTCALLSSPHISGLVELRIWSGPVDIDAARLLAELPMPRLRKLILNDTTLTQAAADVLARAPWLHQLSAVTIDAIDDKLDLSAIKAVITQHGGSFRGS